MKSRRRTILLAVALLLGLVWLVAYVVRPGVTTSSADIPAPDMSEAHPSVVRVIEDLREQVQDDPASDAAWGQLGMVFMAHHWRDEARACFREAARLNPQEMRWLYFPAILVEEHDLAAAADELARAAAVAPAYAPLANRLGVVLMRLNRLEAAEQQFQRAAELAGGDPHPHIGLGRLAARRGDFAAARGHFEQAVAVGPANRDAHAELARVYFRLGNLDAANRQQQIAGQLPVSGEGMPDPVLQEVEQREVAARQLANQADQLAARGDLAGAAAAFRQLIRNRPDLSRPRVNLAMLLHMQGDLAGAMAMYRETIELFPDEALAHRGLAAVLEAAGDVDGAIRSYQDCLRLKPDFAQAHFALGLLLENQGEAAQAIRSYRAAVQSDPRFAPAHLALGVALQKTGDLDAAIDAIQNATRLAPNDPLPRQYLDRALKQREQERSQESGVRSQKL